MDSVTNRMFYQYGCIDPRTVHMYPELTPEGVPYGYQIPYKPNEVSANWTGSLEGPHAPFPADNGQAYLQEATTQAHYILPTTVYPSWAPPAQHRAEEGAFKLPLNWSVESLQGPPAQLRTEEGALDTPVHRFDIKAVDFLGGPLAQPGFMKDAWDPSPSLYNTTAVNGLEGPPAQPGFVERVWDPRPGWYNRTAVNDLECPRAQHGFAEGGFLVAAEWSDPIVLESQEEPPAQPRSVADGDAQMGDDFLQEHPPQHEGTLDPGWWALPVPDPSLMPDNLLADLEELAAQLGIPLDQSSMPAIDSAEEPQVQPGILTEQPLPTAAVNYPVEPPVQPGILAEQPFPTAALDPPEEAPAQLGIPAQQPFSTAAIDLPEKPLAPLEDMVEYFADLPDEATVNSLHDVATYLFDGDYRAKVIFVLENPAAKLTPEHVPLGKGPPASFKFAAKSNYELGKAHDGAKILFRKTQDGDTIKQMIARKEDIWIILCNGHKDLDTGRHNGRDETKKAIENKMNYHGITKKMINSFLNVCPVCAHKRTERRHQLEARKQDNQAADPRPAKRQKVA